MNDLRRELAPIADEGWQAIEQEATRALKTYLAGRRIVDFSGPHGWTHSAVNTGRTRRVEDSIGDGVETRLRIVQPLIELRVPFELAREELDAISRGASAPEIGPVVDAARRLAFVEDRAIFYGYPHAAIRGLADLPPDRAISLAASPEEAVRCFAEALERLREAGVGGPYAVALEPALYNELAKTLGPGRYALLEHVQRLLGGPTIWAPAARGAIVVSQRGGDFEFVVGRDISLGYLAHTFDSVRLYLEESLTFRVLTPDAVVVLIADHVAVSSRSCT